jgi:tRNA-2-methylthio-N6-dimethylallyladenosine synthase
VSNPKLLPAVRFYVRAYGCQMNQYEAGLVREILGREGCTETPSELEADVILLLTCSVREHAEQRAIGRLRNLRALKADRPDLVLAVLGCMAQSRAKELANGLGADLVVGPDDYRRLPELIRDFREQRTPQVAVQLTSECYEGVLPRMEVQNPKSEIQNPVTGMVTVMRGCDNYCSYCVVPYVRGRERSKSRASVLDEVRALIAQGVKDVTLVGQNVLAYHDGELDFAGLLALVNSAISGAPALVRLRFLTSHPKDVTPALAEAMLDLPGVCPHLHLPLQSGSDSILAAMNRRYTRAEYTERVAMLRRTVPNLSLTTDVLVGFPGESDEDFELTLEMVERIGFDFAYMFRYSERPGTNAVGLEPKVPPVIAQQRLAKLIGVQNQITRRRNTALVGQRREVLVEARHGSDYIARTRDGRSVALKCDVAIGKLLTVEITGIQGWTPVGRAVPGV